MIRSAIAWALHFNGFQPIEAANGLEALQWMERAAREQHYPALILLDLAMPGLDGRAFLQWLDANWVGRYPVPALILCTASRSDEDLLTLSPLIKHIISKPFHVHDLLDVVRTWSP
jgi:DNA-binding response OmpR family regulator